jgi:hypothetical protein
VDERAGGGTVIRGEKGDLLITPSKAMALRD